MKIISLDEYKNYLVTKCRYECDNNEVKRQKRMSLLNSKYNNEYLDSIIEGTYNLVNKIIKISENRYYEFIEIPLECEPEIVYIDLNLTGGWWSDIVVSDSDNNFYSIGLLKKIFGPLFGIEPCKVEFTDQWDEEDDFSILSQIPSYSLYIQYQKEIIENLKNEKVLRITKK